MSDGLKIRKLRLRNWKNFLDIEVPIGDRVVLVGANAAGKSNFLDAFRFLRDLASPGGGFHEAVSRRGGTSAIRCLAARQKSDIEIHLELQNDTLASRWSYEIAFHQDPQRRPQLRTERVVHNKTVLVNRPDVDDKRDPAVYDRHTLNR